MSWWARDARKEGRFVLRFLRLDGYTIKDVQVRIFVHEWYAEFRIKDGSAFGSISPDTARYLAACGAQKINDETRLL